MRFFVTFGLQYAREPHPVFPEAHPDNWIEVVAPDKRTARAIARSVLGTSWAFIYGRDEWDTPDVKHTRWFPGECIATLTIDSITQPLEETHAHTP